MACTHHLTEITINTSSPNSSNNLNNTTPHKQEEFQWITPRMAIQSS